MRIIVIGGGELVTSLATRLNIAHMPRVVIDMPDHFVLDGTDLHVSGARALDLVLRAQATEVDAVMWMVGGDPAVLEHYRGRVICLDDALDPIDAALDGLREVLLAT